jgi:hypothetical protein
MLGMDAVMHAFWGPNHRPEMVKRFTKKFYNPCCDHWKGQVPPPHGLTPAVGGILAPRGNGKMARASMMEVKEEGEHGCAYDNYDCLDYYAGTELLCHWEII